MRSSRVPTPILLHWYTCGRKVALGSEVIAHLYAPDKHAYPCPHGHHWHVGRAIQRAKTHAHRQTRRNNARKAWDQQAYKEPACRSERELPRGVEAVTAPCVAGSNPAGGTTSKRHLTCDDSQKHSTRTVGNCAQLCTRVEKR